MQLGTVFRGTEAQNVAILTLTIFFLGQQPPENVITFMLQEENVPKKGS